MRITIPALRDPLVVLVIFDPDPEIDTVILVTTPSHVYLCGI
jgi:hypothetical protein